MPAIAFHSAPDPNDSTVSQPRPHSVAPTDRVAVQRPSCRRSCSRVTAASIKAMAEVSAAKPSSRKKTEPKKLPPGMLPKAIGSVRNTSEGPEPGSRPLANTSGKIAMPASTATPVSAMAMPTQVCGSETSRGAKAPYIIISPMATPIEKKAWLMASSAEAAVSCSKRKSNMKLRPPAASPSISA